tara:strand:- start:123 stop:329 length:207 start_codon:yes stop_codon:yes gene_type:complete
MMSRFLFLIFLAGVSFSALANDSRGISNKIDFSKLKQVRLERLRKMEACISKSTNFKELRACRNKRKN